MAGLVSWTLGQAGSSLAASRPRPLAPRRRSSRASATSCTPGTSSWACPPWRRLHGPPPPTARTAFKPRQPPGRALLGESCELSSPLCWVHTRSCRSGCPVGVRDSLQAFQMHDCAGTHPRDDRSRCAPQVVRLQRAEQRWVLWGREASLGKDTPEQRLGSFDAVVLCDALTARQGQLAAVPLHMARRQLSH